MTDFQLVTRRKMKKKNLNITDKSCISDNFVRTEIDLKTIEARLNDAMCTLKISEFYKDVKELMSKSQVDEIVCYGIGNFADCFISRYQLALLILLREDVLKVPTNYCYFFDPKFNTEEKEFLKTKDFSIISENEEGKRKAERKTLFYMPHCGKSLYNNLLWANWNTHNLSQCIILGNSFHNIVDVNPRRKLEESCWYVLNITPHVTEENLPENFQYTDIFNDTVIISFMENRLQEVTLQTWQHTEMPVYSDDDTEFISNKKLK